MNYQKIYDALMDKAKSRILQNGIKYEIHHIVPRCVGGNNTEGNLVKLTFKEHYFAHKLLTRIYSSNKKIVTAFWMMVITTMGSLCKEDKSNFTQSIQNRLNEIDKDNILKNNLVSSTDYAYCRDLYIRQMIGHDVSKKTRQIISESTKQSMQNIDVVKKCSSGSKNSKHYYNKETLQSHKWFVGDPDIDLNIFAWGRPPMSSEQRKKISDSQKTIKNKYYFNSDFLISYKVYLDDLRDGFFDDKWKVGRKDYQKNTKFKAVLKRVFYKLIDKDFSYAKYLYFHPSKIAKKKKYFSPIVFLICSDFLKDWETNQDIEKMIVDRFIERKNDLDSIYSKIFKR